MKKILAVMAVLAIVCVSVFAADWKASASVGYATDNFVIGDLYTNCIDLGIGAEYALKENINLYADVDLNLAKGFVFDKDIFESREEAKEYWEVITDKENEISMFNVRFAAGAMFELPVNLPFTVEAGAGVSARLNKISQDEDSVTIISMGLEAKLAGTYAINEKISVGASAVFDYSIFGNVTLSDGGEKETVSLSDLEDFNGFANFAVKAVVKYAF